MALSRDQVGLIFRLSAESKDAEEVFEKFKQKVGKDTKELTNIARESFTTLSSEIIESFGVDGDIANSISALALKFKASSVAIVAGLAAIPIAAVAVTAALFALAKSTAEVAEEIDRVNQKTKVSVEALSALRVVAEDNGSSLDQVASALGNLNEKLSDAQRGGKEAQAVFRAVGVDFKGPIDDALRTIVKRLDELPEGANKTAVATELFGDAGADLIPILNELEGDLDAQIEKLRELGLVFDKDGIESAKRFGDQIDALNRQFEGLKFTIGNAVIPTFTGYIGIINQAFSATIRLLKGTSDLTSTIAKLVSLGIIFQNPNLVNALGDTLGKEDEKPEKTGRINLPSKGPKAKKTKTKIEPFELDKLTEDLLKFQRKREAELESQAFEASEKAAQRHQERLEAIERLGSERLIASARARAPKLNGSGELA